MRVAAAAVLAATVLPLAGCGAERPQIIGVVGLALTSPADQATVRDSSTVVEGTVKPAGAVVLVEGKPAERSASGFRATVPLREGANIIDVTAEAPRRRPAVAALRIRRPVTVTVPDVENQSVPAARRRLEALGLVVRTRSSGGLFDELLPGEPHVCRSDPDGGTTVEIPSTVVLDVARGC